MDCLKSKKIITFLCFMNILTALGFGRFLFSLTIPYMYNVLHFSYIQIGTIGGFIICGYLIFSYLGGIVSYLFKEKLVTIFMLLFIAISFLLFYKFTNYEILCFSGFLMGAASASLYVNIFQIINHNFDKNNFGKTLGAILSGAGTGIFLISLFIYILHKNDTLSNIYLVWIIAAVTAIILIPLNSLVKVRNTKNNQNDRFNKINHQDIKIWRELVINPIFRNLTIAYALFGFSYASFTNYIVAYTSEMSNDANSLIVWIIFGGCSIFSSFFWGKWIDISKKIQILFYNYAIILLAILITVVTKSVKGMFLASMFFGLCFFGYLTIFGQIIVKRTTHLSSVYMGKITLIHALGQIIGVYTGGVIRDYTNSFKLVFIICLLATLTSLIFYSKFFKNQKKET